MLTHKLIDSADSVRVIIGADKGGLKAMPLSLAEEALPVYRKYRLLDEDGTFAQVKGSTFGTRMQTLLRQIGEYDAYIDRYSESGSVLESVRVDRNTIETLLFFDALLEGLEGEYLDVALDYVDAQRDLLRVVAGSHKVQADMTQVPQVSADVVGELALLPYPDLVVELHGDDAKGDPLRAVVLLQEVGSLPALGHEPPDPTDRTMRAFVWTYENGAFQALEAWAHLTINDEGEARWFCQSPYHEYTMDTLEAVEYFTSEAVAVLAFMNAERPPLRRVAPPPKLNKKRRKSGKVELDEYHVLDLFGGSGLSGAGNRTKSSPRTHWRRGHFRRLTHDRYKDARGRRVWISHTLVNPEAESSVDKDYRIKRRSVDDRKL